jgi:hypothetical protein
MAQATHGLFALASRPAANRVLTLAFLRAAPDEEDVVNRVTARLSRHGFHHVELVFDGCMAFSIYHGGGAGFRERTLSNPNYELVPLAVSAAEYRACAQFCANASQKGLGFDSLGMYCAVLHPGCECWPERGSERVGATFCSKIIVEALQFGGVREADGLPPSGTTPSSLYAAVRDSDRRVCDSVRVQRPGGVTLALQPLQIR